MDERTNNDEYFPDDPVEIPIEPEIDLHTFHPGEVKEVVEEYIFQCHQRKFPEVRIVHGKGRQVLRKIVNSVLEKSPLIKSYGAASSRSGGHGATIVCLHVEK